ncbi:hypothetical protein FACS189483_10680 [Spirochaetia bacterium]|nr:hypothetical protein FACS189483_10680 [Spirochaetia bacterium]
MRNGKVIFGKAAFFAAVLLAMSAVSAQQVFAQYSREDLQSMYVDFLKSEGYGPSIDSDGDVNFKVEGNNYYIIVNENDLEFFQIYYGINLSTAEERKNAPAAANYATRSTKVVKVYTSSDGQSAVISAEIFMNEPEDFKLVFRRLLRAISSARSDFISKL